MNKHNLKVGQTVYVDHAYRRSDETVRYEITKIGRKWAEVKTPKGTYVAGRFDLETLRWESRNDTVWLSLEERAEARALYKAWEEFKRKVYNIHNRPSAATLENIAKAVELLGL